MSIAHMGENMTNVLNVTGLVFASTIDGKPSVSIVAVLVFVNTIDRNPRVLNVVDLMYVSTANKKPHVSSAMAKNISVMFAI
jgi:hypothetical protein